MATDLRATAPAHYADISLTANTALQVQLPTWASTVVLKVPAGGTLTSYARSGTDGGGSLSPAHEVDAGSDIVIPYRKAGGRARVTLGAQSLYLISTATQTVSLEILP